MDARGRGGRREPGLLRGGAAGPGPGSPLGGHLAESRSSHGPHWRSQGPSSRGFCLGGLALQAVQEGCSPEQMAISTPLVNSPECRRSLVLALVCLQGGLWGAGRKMGTEHLSGMVPLQNQGPGQASGKRSNLWEFPGSPGVGTWVPILGQGTKIPKLQARSKF